MHFLMNSMIVRQVCFIFIFSCLMNHVHAQQKPKSDKPDISTLLKQYKEGVAQNDYGLAKELSGKINHYYQRSSKWDSVYYYNEQFGNFARDNKEYDDHIKCFNDNIFISRMMGKGDEDKLEKMEYLKAFVRNSDRNNIKKATLCHTLSSYYYEEGQLDSTFYFQRLAIKHADLMGDKDDGRRVFERMQLATYHQETANTAKALEIYTEVEPLIQEGKVMPPMKLIQFNRGIASALLDVGDYDRAVDYIENITELIADNKFKTLNHYDFHLRAKHALLKGEYLQAANYYKKTIKGLRKARRKDRLYVAYKACAESYLKAGKIDSTRIYLDSISNIDKQPEKLQLEYHRIQGNLALTKGDLSKAKHHLDIVNNRFKNLEFYPLSRSLANYNYYNKAGNKAQALEYYKLYTHQKDSIRQLSNAILSKRIESEFNREKQDIEIKSLTETTAAKDRELAVRNTALIMGSIMLLILGGLLLGLYRLYKRNQENQKQLAEQNIAISKALEQNQMLIKEIHHRVKNNLQVVSSLLNMQARKTTDEDTLDALNSSKTRVQSMSILHQSLYQGDQLKEVDVDKYLDELVENIVDTYQIEDKVQFDVDIDPIALDVDVLVPLGLIANELITNALKYAFEGIENGHLLVSFKERDDKIVLRVKDNGVGIGANQLPLKKGSLGAQLIDRFSERLGGHVEVNGTAGGTDIQIYFNKVSLKLV